MITGQCLCGDVAWQIEPPLTTLLHCHCRMCRKTHGSPFVTFAVAPRSAFRFTAGVSPRADARSESPVATSGDSIVRFRSSAQALRPFCRRCGTAVPSLDEAAGIAICPAGALDGDLGLTPRLHMFVQSKAPWHVITDTLPQCPEYPPEFGMQAVPVPAATAAAPGRTRGSCLCGAVAYEFTGVAQRMYYCHCGRCRRSRAAAHGAQLFVEPRAFAWLHGEDDVTDYALPGGRYFGSAHCRTCGSKLPRVQSTLNLVTIPCGSLDDDPGIRAQAHIFVGSKAAWYPLTDDLPRFEALPH
jgi:hypothetical protein